MKLSWQRAEWLTTMLTTVVWLPLSIHLQASQKGKKKPQWPHRLNKTRLRQRFVFQINVNQRGQSLIYLCALCVISFPQLYRGPPRLPSLSEQSVTESDRRLAANGSPLGYDGFITEYNPDTRKQLSYRSAANENVVLPCDISTRQVYSLTILVIF